MTIELGPKDLDDVCSTIRHIITHSKGNLFVESDAKELESYFNKLRKLGCGVETTVRIGGREKFGTLFEGKVFETSEGFFLAEFNKGDGTTKIYSRGIPKNP